MERLCILVNNMNLSTAIHIMIKRVPAYTHYHWKHHALFIWPQGGAVVVVDLAVGRHGCFTGLAVDLFLVNAARVHCGPAVVDTGLAFNATGSFENVGVGVGGDVSGGHAEVGGPTTKTGKDLGGGENGVGRLRCLGAGNFRSVVSVVHCRIVGRLVGRSVGLSLGKINIVLILVGY